MKWREREKQRHGSAVESAPAPTSAPAELRRNFPPRFRCCQVKIFRTLQPHTCIAHQIATNINLQPAYVQATFYLPSATSSTVTSHLPQSWRTKKEKSSICKPSAITHLLRPPTNIALLTATSPANAAQPTASSKLKTMPLSKSASEKSTRTADTQEKTKSMRCVDL